MVSFLDIGPHGFEPADEDNSESLKLLAISHAEVTRHDRNLDEKVRSILTALAFLMIAGVTLFIYSNPHEGPKDITFDGQSWNAANFFFVLFLVSLILTLMAALVAVDPGSFQPNFLRRHHGRYSILDPSDIVAESGKLWLSHARSSAATMRKNLRRSYALETLDVAQRTTQKERRLGDAQGLIFMAMVNLGLMGAVRLPHSSNHTRAVVVIAILIVLPALAAPATLWFMYRDKYLEEGSLRKTWDLFWLYGMPILIVWGLAGYAFKNSGPYWIVIYAGLAATFTTSHPSVILFYELINDPRAVTSSRSRQPWRLLGISRSQGWRYLRWRIFGLRPGGMVWPVIGAFAVIVPWAHWDPSIDSPIKSVQKSIVSLPSGGAVACARVHGHSFDAVRLTVIRDGRQLKHFPTTLLFGAHGDAVVSVLMFGKLKSQEAEFQFRRYDTDVNTRTYSVSQLLGGRTVPKKRAGVSISDEVKGACIVPTSASGTPTTNRAVTIWRS